MGVVMLAWAAAGFATAAEPVRSDCTRAAAFTVEHYAAELELDLAGQSLLGNETADVRSRADGAVVLAFDAPGLTVESVRLRGRPLRSVRDGGRLCVVLDRPLRGGQSARLAFRYRAGPSEGLRFFADHAYTAYATSRWLVSLDDPAQRATFELGLTLPSGLQAVGTGQALGVAKLRDGRERHAFRQRLASPGFLFGFAAGRFRRATRPEGGTLLQALVPQSVPEQAGELEAALGVAAQALRFFRERAGVPFPGERYTQVFVAGDEEQEAAGMSLQRASYLAELRENPREDWLVVHELAHQFWAYLLPCEDFADFWLNEGLASFMVAAFKESRWGRSAYDEELALFRLRYGRVLAAGKDQPLAPRPEGPTVRGITYAKGALVLHLLRSELGETAFWDGLRRYSQGNAGRPVRTAQLLAAFEAASGTDLSALCEIWVRHLSPAPVVARHRWADGQLVLEVQAGALLPLALDVAWVEPDGTRRTRRLVVSAADREFRFPTAQPPVSVRFDDGARLPLAVRHERSVEMLLFQLVHEPDAPGRLDALHELRRRCPGPTPECEQVRSALRRSSSGDASWLLRSEAEHALAAP